MTDRSVCPRGKADRPGFTRGNTDCEESATCYTGLDSNVLTPRMKLSDSVIVTKTIYTF